MTLLSLTASYDTAKDKDFLAENQLSATPITVSENEETASVKQSDNNIIYQNDNVVVTKVDPLISPNVVCNLWDMPTETEMYNDCDLIADVTIKSLEEVTISYTFMGAECTSYKTLVNVSMNKTYYSADENIDQEFTVAIPNSSYSFDESFPEISVNERCILFISDTEGLNDSLELDSYAEYYLSSPANVININGSKCRANKIFASYSNSAAAVVNEANADLLEGEVLIESDETIYSANNNADGVSAEQYDMSFADFEKTLMDKIGGKMSD